MPWFDFFWTPDVIAKIGERGITQEEVEELLSAGGPFEASARSGLPMVRGEVSTGRYLIVIFRWLDDITIEVVTAFTPDKG